MKEHIAVDDRQPMRVVFVPYWGSGNPYQDALAEHLSACGAEVVKMRSPRALFRWGVFVRQGIDVVHLHWLPSFGWEGLRLLRCMVFVTRLLLIRLQGIPIVWTIHNLMPHESRHPRADWLIGRAVAGLARAMIVHGETARGEVIRRWGLRSARHVAVIPHGNYVDHYANHLSRSQARQRFGIDESKTVFLFLGAVRPYKGVLDLVESFRKLADAESCLIIAGKPLDEAYRKQVQAAIGQVANVHFDVGFVADDDIQVYMKAADVVVLPYRNILSSGAALLAMSFGKACVAPARGCLSDVLDATGAFLYDPEDEEGLLHSLREALNKTDALDRMGRHNQERAALWTWDKMAQTIADLYRGCLAAEDDDQRGADEEKPPKEMSKACVQAHRQ
jgi:glycosyltransferase involved in cell wall biosynthesis